MQKFLKNGSIVALSCTGVVVPQKEDFCCIVYGKEKVGELEASVSYFVLPNGQKHGREERRFCVEAGVAIEVCNWKDGLLEGKWEASLANKKLIGFFSKGKPIGEFRAMNKSEILTSCVFEDGIPIIIHVTGYETANHLKWDMKKGKIMSLDGTPIFSGVKFREKGDTSRVPVDHLVDILCCRGNIAESNGKFLPLPCFL
uniref:MORN repeat-containing protein n=1 Tax=Marseillevirus sp. TaxID=2809551 RepID=A0AA96J113_9VIRU|nr:hypothetical protein MarQu_113 [Marseillevirus sp.]WNL50237.1 hypothetical protein MarDSR_198 [Marseillevirus sp.]